MVPVSRPLLKPCTIPEVRVSDTSLNQAPSRERTTLLVAAKDETERE
jgi:hypothetical protein